MVIGNFIYCMLKFILIDVQSSATVRSVFCLIASDPPSPMLASADVVLVDALF